MRILYDYQAFQFQYYGGVSKCFCELIKNLPSYIDYDIAVKESNNVHLMESNLVCNLKKVSIDSLTFKKRYPFTKGGTRIYNLLQSIPFCHTTEKENRYWAIKKLEEQNFDIFHPTFFDSYFLEYLGHKPFVMTIHDMMPELYPEFFNMRNKQIINKREQVKKAAAIIAVSENTKYDIVKLLNVDENKIHVVYHGGPTPSSVVEDPIITGDYFLYVGLRHLYKNFIQTLKDFAAFTRRGFTSYKLVCTGPDFTESEILEATRLGIKDNLLHINASEKQMKNLYFYAKAFIYPSLYEGFGMPILEAFSYGCPALLNKTSCFPEVAGNAAVYFESINGQSNLTDILTQFSLLEEIKINEIKSEGYKQLSKYSWEKSASQLANIYKAIH